MNPTREAVLKTAEIVRPLLASPEVAAKWDQPSVLAEFSVRGLAGHLVRAVAMVGTYLDDPVPEGDPISAPAYFGRLGSGKPDLRSPASINIRARGEEAGAGGPQAVVATLDEAIARLRKDFVSAPADRKMSVTNGAVMRLDDYLVTRLVEAVVHADDLAQCVGLDTPPWPPEIMEPVLGHLMAVARVRHGDLAVLRALTRRERDKVEALRVF